MEEEEVSVLSHESEYQGMYRSQEMKSTLEGLFEADTWFRFNFPDSFMTVPTLLQAEMGMVGSYHQT